MPSRIEDYALIGDCETSALVGKDGSIDWLCWPRFDSAACFAALLGTPEHGCWKLAPASAPAKVLRRYRENTLILETRYETGQGSVTLVDFMPLHAKNSQIVRLVRGEQGSVEMRMELVLRFDYGELVPWVTRLDDGALRAIAGPNMVVLRTSAPIRGEDLKTVAHFTMQAGETLPFVLSYAASHRELPVAIDPQQALKQTDADWRKWIGACSYSGPHADAVKRSLITLKALSYWPTGGLIAAPTTSLPEKPGGSRNWDYRYCWLRDATLVLQTLMRAGYLDEASDWRDWLVRAVAGSPDQVQIMYGIAGERHLKEWQLDGLPGYEGSKPVRIGNAAADQLQLDIYGEIAGVLHNARMGGLPEEEPGIALEWALLEHLEKIWRQPDESIWEVRGGPKQFTFSKVMAWAAFDSAIKSCERFGFHAPVDRWRAVQRQIHEDVCRNGFCAELGSFVQSYGSKDLDASLLMMPRVGFLPVSDPRLKGTIEAIERHLLRGGFVERYHTRETSDALPPGEGVFLACSFWLADAFVLMGRRNDAQRLFESLLALRNDVGLLSEEYDPEEKRLLGNFPQAFSHLALVNTAFSLSTSQ